MLFITPIVQKTILRPLFLQLEFTPSSMYQANTRDFPHVSHLILTISPVTLGLVPKLSFLVPKLQK